MTLLHDQMTGSSGTADLVEGRQADSRESQNQIDWKRPWRSSNPTYDLMPPYQLNHCTKCHIQVFLKQFQGLFH